MKNLNHYFFPKTFFGISIKYFILVQLIIVILVGLYWFTDLIKNKDSSSIIEKRFYEAELNAEIDYLTKNNGTVSFILKNDTTHYVIGFARNNNYSPPDLYDFIEKNHHISKKAKSNTIIIDSLYMFTLFTVIEKEH